MTKKIIAAYMFILWFGLPSCSSNQPAKKNPRVTDASAIISDMAAGKNIFIQDQTIHGDLDFTSVPEKSKEGKGLQRVYFSGSITFINCVFTGKIKGYSNVKEEIILCDFAKNLTFSECQFKEEFSLRESIVHGNASFNGSFFIGKTSFEGARFMGEAGFNKANFGEELRIQNASFYFKCNFMDAVFGKTAYFQASLFFADAQLSNARWMGYADFSLCSFSGGAFFNYSVFSDRAVFNNSIFRGRAEFLKTTFTGPGDFRNCQYYGQVKMNDAEVQQSLNLAGSVFLLNMPDTALIRKTGNATINTDLVKTGLIR